MTVKDALHFRESRPEGVTTCKIDETIETIANRLVKAEVGFLVTSCFENFVFNSEPFRVSVFRHF